MFSHYLYGIIEQTMECRVSDLCTRETSMRENVDEEREPRFHGNDFLASLSPDVFSLIEPYLKQIVISQGSVCFEPAERIRDVYFPITGMISLLVLMADGSCVETGSIGWEGAAGLQTGFGESSSSTRAIVRITGLFYTMSAIQFERAVRNSGILRDCVFRHLETLWTDAHQMAACNAAHDCSGRLCRCLLQTADRTGGEHVPLTQEVLAEMLGVRRTTVTLVARQLERRGLIKYTRGNIRILDRPSLETSTCECYRVMRHEHKIRSRNVGSPTARLRCHGPEERL